MNREAQIGLFVILGMLVVAYFVLRTTDIAQLWSGEGPPKNLTFEVEDASGIREGTAVRVSGVKVGEVVGVRLVGTKAEVEITVPADLELRSGTIAEMRAQGILGEKYVALVIGNGQVVEDPDIQAKSAAGIDDITSVVKQISDELLVITKQIREGLEDPNGANRMENIVANIERLTAGLADTLNENRGDVRTTTSEIATLSQQLNRDIPALVKEMTDLTRELKGMATDNKEQVNSTVRNIESLSANLEEAGASFKSIAGKVDQGEGSIGKLVNESETVDNLNKVLVKAEESLDQIGSFLDSTANINMDLHFRSEYLAEHETAKSYFGLRITPDDSKYYLLEGVSRENDYLPFETRETVTRTYDADGNLLTTATTTEIDRADELVFTGQLAYRFGDIFLRGGVIESEGGGGLDYLALDDRFKFSFEAFDFNRANDFDAHGKIDFSYKFSDHIIFNAGWDDFFVSELESAYLGGGIRWKDEDLKVLLGALGGAIK